MKELVMEVLTESMYFVKEQWKICSFIANFAEARAAKLTIEDFMT